MQFACRHVRRDRNLFGHGNGTGIEPGIHLHDHHAGFAIACHDGTLDRSSPAPARQQRGMAVIATEARCIQNGLRQQQTIGHDNRDIGFEACENVLLFHALEALRREHRNTELFGLFMHR